jgi:hypothetical protein
MEQRCRRCPWCAKAERLVSHASSTSLTKTLVFTQPTLVRTWSAWPNEAAVNASMPFQSLWASLVLLEKRLRPVVKALPICIRRPPWAASFAPAAVHHGASDTRLPGLHPPSRL